MYYSIYNLAYLDEEVVMGLWEELDFEKQEDIELFFRESLPSSITEDAFQEHLNDFKKYIEKNRRFIGSDSILLYHFECTFLNYLENIYIDSKHKPPTLEP